MNLIQELKWRGMLQDITPGTEEQLNKEMTVGYIGFDPTADSLHIGSLVPIILLMHLQRAGHKPIALVGGATGMVGDPSGKSEERNLLSSDKIAENLSGIKKQLEKFLDFDANKKNAASILNNYDWTKNISFLDFLRDIGKHITINYMMAKDSVKKRIESATGISYTEFAYQLLQGFDFLWLYENMNCKLQMGGSDQWGNIVTGTELIRRKVGGEAFALTCPLMTKADGGKFGKTEQGNVWLDANKTSPYHFYQFWINSSDEDCTKWIKIFTFLSQTEIEKIIEEHKQQPEKRILQKKLAEEITTLVHGSEALQQAIQTTESFFKSKNDPNAPITIEELQAVEDKIELAKSLLDNKIDIVSLLADTKIFPSKSEARKMIAGGGVSLNRKKITDVAQTISSDNLLFNKFLLIQKGKKNYYLLSFN